jgi:photosystem II stability/assembly factor-like uncharacterized protein
MSCGLVVSAPAHAQEVLPATGALRATTMQRLLLVDAARIGNRIVAAVRFVDAKQGWAVGHDSVILASGDGGESWTQQFSAPKEQRPLLDVEFLDASNGIAVGAYGAYYETSDGGKTWKDRKVLADDKHLNAIVRVRAGKLVLLGEAGTILTSADDGRNWTVVASPYKGSLFGGVVAEDGAIVAFGLRGRIYRSTDEGNTWTQVDNPSTATLVGGSRLPGGGLVLAGSAGTALLSRDGGKTFTPLPTGSTRAFSKAIPGAADQLLMLGEAGARGIALPAAR